MKPTSIQPNNEPNESLRDDIYTLFQMEVERRGIAYFDMLSTFPSISNGASSVVIESLLSRLALSPSIFSIITTKDPEKTINDLISGLPPKNEKVDGLIRDFIDDIGLNVRIKAANQYHDRLTILSEQITDTVPLIISDEQDIAASMNYFNKNKHLILTIYYLRKLGYGTLTKSTAGK